MELLPIPKAALSLVQFVFPATLLTRYHVIPFESVADDTAVGLPPSVCDELAGWLWQSHTVFAVSGDAES